MQRKAAGYDYHRVAYLKAVMTARYEHFLVPEYCCNENVGFERKFHQRNIDYRGLLLYDELCGFDLALDYVVEGFHVAADGAPHCADITHDIVRGYVLGIYYRIEIKMVYYAAEVDTVYFCYELAVPGALREK